MYTVYTMEADKNFKGGEWGRIEKWRKRLVTDLRGIGDGRRQPAAAQGDGLVGLPGLDLGQQESFSGQCLLFK
ncbi:hypothetical protein GUJ93_ZPchr0004g38766 [Zizania palustris]|uniref:Uncharacterized protein n=1 Tax=Zizania palustris TaxID=103762 RepID=A0A8J5T4G7_ZIZPA|nr:hypothetical protein GUJ93_ZPchr0004g38766 [Zizania palustris]